MGCRRDLITRVSGLFNFSAIIAIVITHELTEEPLLVYMYILKLIMSFKIREKKNYLNILLSISA